jgi:hypothetical protein
MTNMVGAKCVSTLTGATLTVLTTWPQQLSASTIFVKKQKAPENKIDKIHTKLNKEKQSE